VLVIAAGDRRVSEARIAALLGEAIERASPEFVREHSGFAIGGVAPVAHATPMTTFIDASLRRFDVVWAAGGTPHSVFPIRPDELVRVSAGTETVTDAWNDTFLSAVVLLCLWRIPSATCRSSYRPCAMFPRSAACVSCCANA